MSKMEPQNTRKKQKKTIRKVHPQPFCEFVTRKNKV